MYIRIFIQYCDIHSLLLFYLANDIDSVHFSGRCRSRQPQPPTTLTAQPFSTPRTCRSSGLFEKNTSFHDRAPTIGRIFCTFSKLVSL